MMRDEFVATVSLLFSLAVVCAFVFIGWYIVWALIISRFRFIKELLSTSSTENSSTITELKNARNRTRKSRKD